ncbi:MAG: hypothetical protein AAF939_06705 [Planctomycetota bacterium]
MPAIEIEIRQSKKKAIQPIGAYLIPLGDTSQWINEIASWPVAHHELKLLVLANQSKSDPPALFVFGNVPKPDQVSVRCLAYGLFADRIWIPFDSILFPNVSSQDLDRLIVADRTYVWSPQFGLFGADADELLSVSDLLNFKLSNAAWNSAKTGLYWPDRISQVIPSDPFPSVDELMDQLGGNIGSQADKPKDILDHPSSVPTDSAITQLARNALGPFVYAADKLAQHLPSSIRGRISTWSSRFFQSASEAVSRKRNQELHRLMDMLDGNPDEGLKFALPFSSWMQNGRGFSRPGSSLMKQLVNFDLSSLFGGGANNNRAGTDYWDVSDNLRNQLIDKYRELAKRELNLGRYRRAAYIYAHLIGDLNNAANVLVQGRHFREAAVLYRDKLGRKEQAIECLIQGGLYRDAIDLCEQDKQIERAGDLWQKIGKPEEALGCYNQAVKVELDRHDIIEAARIQEDKINDRQLALQTLASGWPDSIQAESCMRTSLRMLRELGDHQGTRDWYLKVVEQAANRNLPAGMIQRVSKDATDYPDPLTRQAATQSTQQAVSRILKRKPQPYAAKEYLDALKQLDPSDKLLRRDCRRYCDQLNKASDSKLRLKRSSAQSAKSSGKLKVVNRLVLPSCSGWISATGLYDQIVALGCQSKNELLIARCDWKGDLIQSASAQVNSQISDDWFHFEDIEKRTDPLVVVGPNSLGGAHVLGASLPEIRFTDTESTRACSLSTFPGWSSECIAATFSHNNLLARIRIVESSLIADYLNSDGHLVSSNFVTDVNGNQLDFDLTSSCYFSGKRLYVSWQDRVYCLGKTGHSEPFSVNQPVVRMTGTPLGTRTRIAVAMQKGVEVFWHDYDGIQTVEAARHLNYPLVRFSRAGHLAIASGSQLEIYSTAQKKLMQLGSLNLKSMTSNSKITDLIQCGQANQIAVLTQSGEILFIEIKG